MKRALLPVLFFVVVAATAYAPPPEPRTDRPAVVGDTDRWAWPENPENLQVIPDDVEPERLRMIMQSFTRALGVRCSFCHVGQGDFLNWDFASDANPHKDVARDMMRMTRDINEDELEEIEGLHDVEAGTFRVTCWTCHRGSATPETSPPPEPDEAAPPTPPGQPVPADPPVPPADGHQHPPGQQHQH